MKKFILFFVFILSFIFSFSQGYPIQQFIGADSAVVTSKGGLQGRFINVVFADTTAANSQRVRQYPGAMIYASGKLWVRNTTATGWTELAYGPITPVNIYNSDGTLTGPRTLDGSNDDLTFDNMAYFTVNGNPLGQIRFYQGSNSNILMRGDTTAISRRLSYNTNLGSSFTKHSVVDKNYVDSSITASPSGTVTSVATNNATGITGGPITTTGTLAIDTNLISTRAWRQKGVDSVASLPKVTSVGLSMPTAFAVANSPVISSGTLTVTGAGVASQYIRGDGQLATLPTTGGGGSSVSYYLNGSVNQGTFAGTPYYEMSKTAIFGAGTDFTISSNGYIASFITDAGDPSLLNIPAGNWDFEVYFQSSSTSGTPSFYVELYKYDGSTFTLIASSSANPEFITNGTAVDAYYTPLAVPSTSLLVTDRLAVRIYVNNSGNTITLHTEDNNLCQIITTFSTGINALNGLTSQVQYLATGTSGTDFNISSLTDTHTFNLPTASATNRGALSSADWTTFNSKIGPSDTASMLSPYLRKVDTTAMLSPYKTFYPRTAISLTTTGTSGAATYNNSTGVLNVPQYADQFTGTVTSVATNTATGITGGTITTTGTLAIDTNLISTRAWRQKGIDSVASLANSKIDGSGTTNYVSKFTASGTIGNSQIFDNGTNVGIGTASPSYLLDVNGTARVSGTAVFNTATNTSSIQALVSATTFAALYLDQATPSGTNYAIASDGTNTLVNAASTSVNLRVGNSDRAVVYSNGNLSSGTLPADIGFSLNLTSAGSSGLIRAGNFTYGAGGRFVHFNYGDETQTSSNYSIYYESGDLIFNTKTGGVFKYRINNTDVGRIFTNGNFFIGSSPVDGGYKLDISGTTRISGTELRLDNGTTGVINLYSATPSIQFAVGAGDGYSLRRVSTSMILSTNGTIQFTIGGNSAYTLDGTNGHVWRTGLSGGAALARLTTGGNLIVGGTTDAGFKFDVQGTARINGVLTFGSTPTLESFGGNQQLKITSALGLTISSDRWNSNTSTSSYIQNGYTTKNFITTNAANGTFNSFDFSASNAYQPTIANPYTQKLINGAMTINSTAATNTFHGVSISTTDNSASIANNVFAVYADATLGTNTSATRWAGYFIGRGYFSDVVGIGTTSPSASSILHLSSTTKGFLPPVMTGAQAEAIGTPAAGLMVYANNGNGVTITSIGWWGYNGTTWVKLN